ncbi:hypothetical protein ON010_g13223 [Phytophthora cinnamomi]|nr:hypothetical protein ON010_g13223 [Phytophthora cinnamomi]
MKLRSALLCALLCLALADAATPIAESPPRVAGGTAEMRRLRTGNSIKDFDDQVVNTKAKLPSVADEERALPASVSRLAVKLKERFHEIPNWLNDMPFLLSVFLRHLP